MKRSVVVCSGLAVVALTIGGLARGSSADEPPQEQAAAAQSAAGPVLETLLKAELEGVEGIEVIVSRVTIPPNTSLPKHWHPGEEFAYVLEGSASLWIDGEAGPPAQAGSVVEVPLKRVHTARTGDEGATVLVFRVHERGQPERVPVDE